jgi:hypothetical protein
MSKPSKECNGFFYHPPTMQHVAVIKSKQIGSCSINVPKEVFDRWAANILYIAVSTVVERQ